MNRWISFSKQVITTPEVVVGDTSLQLQCRTLILQLPIAVFAWNRPVAVQVFRKGQLSKFAMSGKESKW